MNILDVRMVGINELYPTESLAFIDPEIIKHIESEIKADGTDTEIITFLFEDHYYIYRGHDQLMAAAFLHADKVRIFLVDYKELPFFCDENNLKNTLSSIGMSTIYDFEGICGFTYPEYPKYYRK